MRSIVKQPLIISLALIINLILFLLIGQLVSHEAVPLPEFEDLHWVDYIRLEQKDNTMEESRKPAAPDEPPPPEQTPPLPEISASTPPRPQQPAMALPTPNINVPLAISGTPYLGDYLKSSPVAARPDLSDIVTDVVPTTRVEPVYPPRALRAGIEGVVTAEFTIASDGSVKDIEIVAADPPGVFDNAVTQAILKWKFAPHMADGQAIEKRARQDIRFTLKK